MKVILLKAINIQHRNVILNLIGINNYCFN